MSEEREEIPTMDLRKLKLSYPGENDTTKTQKIKLDCAAPIKEGKGDYGMWHLWVGFVENAPVTWGRGKEQRIQESYTGKVFFFPTSKLNESLLGLTKGNTNVEVLFKKTVEEGKKGLIMKYVAEKLSDGTPSESTLTPTETNFLNDVRTTINKGFAMDENMFANASQDGIYDGKITIERAKELYKKFVAN